MNLILRNFLAFVAGALVGSMVNMAIIMVSSSIIPPPIDADVTTLEGLKASMHLFGPQHFIMPFLAHALGTFAGAFLTTKMALSHHMKFALGIGVLFLAGGLANIIMLPSPLWFSILDAVGAYLPMAYLAGRIGQKNSTRVP
ncbi:MAG: hypothetical protein PSX36_02830 [bacterium]|nr:hypothetical protein [bacterium]